MAPSRDNPGVIAPPPLIYGGMLALGLLVDAGISGIGNGWLLGMPGGRPGRYGVAGILGIAAVLLAASAFEGFRRAGTNVEPWKPSVSLVTNGVYGITRNPMYLAMALLYAAIGLIVDGRIALVLLVPTLLIVRGGVIDREERYLDTKFGEEYRRYRAKVRRWI